MKKLEMPKQKISLSFINISLLMTLFLVVTSWFFVIAVEKANLFDIFSHNNFQFTKKFLSSLLGLKDEIPAYRNPEMIKNAVSLTLETLQMSIMAIGFAAIGMVLTVIPAASNAANGTLTLSAAWYNRILFFVIRSFYIFSRAVPELIWAMLIIFVFKPGIVPGAIALALHNFGILGKLCAEVIEDLDSRPVTNLAACGASKSQILLYGIVPMVMPKFVTFLLYRWEVIIRTTIIVGFVGAGGLGRQFKLSMSWFHYSEVTLILLSYLVMVLFADLLSELLRRIAQ